MPPSREDTREAQRLCKMALACSQAMSRDVPVALWDSDGLTLAEGRIVRRSQSDQYGVVVFVEGSEDPVPLPFIQRMTLI